MNGRLDIRKLVYAAGKLSLCFLISIPCHAYAGDDVTLRNRVRIKKKSELIQPRMDDSDEFNDEKMSVLSNQRHHLLREIQKFLKESKNAEQKAELNMRLAALYMEEYTAALARAQEAYEQNRKQHRNGPSKMDTSESTAALDRARAIYQDLLRRYPQHRRRDEIVYQLGVATVDKGLVKEGMDLFKHLIALYPKSRFANDALIQLGDYYFEENKFPTAETYYNQILARKYQRLIPYTVYKKAWCSYNLGKPSLALQQFKWVIQNEELLQAASSIKIKGEALRDSTLVWVELKLVDESMQFFKAQGPVEYRRGLESMASQYSEKGDYKVAIRMWESLLDEDSNHRKNAYYDTRIIEALYLAHDENGAIQRLFSRLPTYLGDSSWHEINSSDPHTIQEASTKFEELSRKYAFQFHSVGQKTHNETFYRRARDLYSKYLDFFPHTTSSPQVRFFLAEILYKQGDFREAAEHYYLVYKEPLAGELREDAIQHALASLDRQLNSDRKKQGLSEINSKSKSKLKEKEDLAFVEFSPLEKRFIEISKEYLKRYSKAEDAPEVFYTQIYLEYTHHDFDTAYNHFWELIKAYPKHETAYNSGHLVLDILNRRNNYQKLIAACHQFLDMQGFSRASFKAEVADILRHAELKAIQLVEEKEKFKEAADQYVNYIRVYGTQDETLYEKALYNASINYFKASEYVSAVDSQEHFLRQFPESSYKESMLLQVAKTYELLAQFDKAALYFDQFSNTYPNHAQAKNALRLAGLYYWGSGNATKAENLMHLYLKRYPKEIRSVEKDLLAVYESQSNVSKQLAFLNQVRFEHGITYSRYLNYTLKMAQLSGAQNGSLMEEMLTLVQKHPKDLAESAEGTEAMSKVLFWSTSRKETYYHRIRLTRQEHLEKNLKLKLGLLKELEREYERIAKLGSPEWGLGAIYQSAANYHELALDILQAPVPSELSTEQLELYRKELQNSMVKPFNEKALSLAVRCLDKAQDLNLLSSWTPKCYALASEVEPKHYPMVRTFYLPPYQSALMVPNRRESKIARGDLKFYAYPYFSSNLFSSSPEMANRTPNLENVSAVPNPLNYQALADDRREVLNSAFESEKPSDFKKNVSFSVLNLMRFVSPKKAQPLILEAISKDPKNEALHNLLALTYLEQGNLPAAKVTWLALGARGSNNAALWNNLGVVAGLEHHESQAIEYFNEAAKLDDAKEAQKNLGFIALKYRNGSDAKSHFEKALSFEKDDSTAQVGLAVAHLQNREIESVKQDLIDLTGKYKKDPYAKLSLGYFLIDVEKESELAKKVLSDYVAEQAVEGDSQFRETIQDSAFGAPEIER